MLVRRCVSVPQSIAWYCTFMPHFFSMSAVKSANVPIAGKSVGANSTTGSPP